MAGKPTYGELEERIRQLEEELRAQKEAGHGRSDLEEAFRVSEEEKAIVLDSMSELVVYHDPNRRILWANRASGESVGLPVDQLLGRRCYDIWGDGSGPCPGCPVQEAYQNGQVKEAERTSPDGRWWFIRAHPVRGPGGAVMGMVEVALDISERKRAEEALHKRKEELRARLRELECLKEVSRLVETPGISLPDILQGVVNLMPSAWPDSATVSARIIFADEHFETANFRETAGREAVDISVRGDQAGTLEVSSPEELSRVDDELVLKKQFMRTVAERLGRIIERMQAEQALRETEERFRVVADFSYDWEYWIRPDGTNAYTSPSCERITGYSAEEFLEDPALLGRITYPAERDLVTRHFKEELEHKHDAGFEFDFRIVTRQGDERWIGHTCQPVYGSDGRCLGRRAGNRDITVRKQAEEALAASEERYRSFVENFHGIAFKGTMDVGTVFLHGSVEKITGYTEDEFLAGRPRWDQIIHPDDLRVFSDNAEKVRSAPRYAAELEYRIVRKDGGVRWIHEMTRNVCGASGTPAFVQGALYDITERKQAEEALKESEAKYASLVEQATDGVYIVQDEVMQFANTALAEMYGYEVDELLGKSVFDTVAPEARDKIAGRYRRRLKGEPPPACYESKGLCRDGTVKSIELSAQVIQYHGRPAVMGIVRDITARKQAEEALRQSKGLLESILSSLNEAVFVMDPRTRTFVACNAAVERIFGYRVEELVGRGTCLLHVDQTACARFAQEALESLARHGMYQAEYQLRRKDGTIIPTEHVVTEIRDGTWARTGVVSVVRDITDRKKRDEDLIRTQKLESVGVLAGGIAHDFNNLLVGIMGNISLARVSRHLDPETLDLLNTAEKAALRAKHLTGQLLTFARGGAPIRKIVSISGLLEEMGEFAVRGSNVRCEFGIPEDLWLVEADEGQISQAINNLVMNARQASPEGGTITIRARNMAPEEERPVALRKGRYIRVSIEDKGVGIPEEHLAKVFDPYFTTKEKGQGLGLAITHSIIEKHGGYIEVESAVGDGTTFHVYLPARAEEIPARRKEDGNEKGGHPIKGGHGKILLLDDELMVRNVGKNLLHYLGYRVTVAEDAEEAIARYKTALEAGEPFDAVILDLTIPGGRGGRDVIKSLLQIDPGVKGLVSSGYHDDPVMSQYKECGFRGVITKPYDLEQLNTTLRKVIKEARE